jgi:OmpA-OmpF porin, OOP family
MSSALVTGITDIFRSQVAGPFASTTGESESSVVRGFETTLGTMVESMAAKIRQSGFASQLMDLINSPANDPRMLENPQKIFGSQSSEGLTSKFTSMLFGGKSSALSEEIGSASGIRGRTAASLMAVGTPLLLGTLRKRVRDANMDPSRLTGFLATEAAGIHGSLPAQVERFIVPETQSFESVPPVTSAAVRGERSRSWLWPVLLGILVLGGLLWWAGARRHTIAGAVTHRLPNNVQLQFPGNKIEDQVLRFIEDPSKSVDQTSWLDFDRLRFDTNSATLQPGSTEELTNIAQILKAYPNVHVKIGGFTDAVGSPEENMLLSRQRADTVKQQLVGMGISEDRIEAQGYGPNYPVANNGTNAGRQENRRAALLVTQK